MLIQERDLGKVDDVRQCQVATKRKPTPEEPAPVVEVIEQKVISSNGKHTKQLTMTDLFQRHGPQIAKRPRQKTQPAPAQQLSLFAVQAD